VHGDRFADPATADRTTAMAARRDVRFGRREAIGLA
jgi:hypothetical protein